MHGLNYKKNLFLKRNWVLFYLPIQVALKDLDFLDSDDAMRLAPDTAQLLNETIAADIQLLSEMKIMDYS